MFETGHFATGRFATGRFEDLPFRKPDVSDVMKPGVFKHDVL
jgi:hypothetical protein